MQYLLKLTFLLLQFSIASLLTAAEKTQPYCYKNLTETSYKTVTKTRLKNVSSKNFFKKIISKKDTQIELYEEQEPVYKIKLERFCCEGYKMTEYDQCEPQCVENGCPENSKCVEPEVCECSKGYFSTRSVHNGKHTCQPICEKACPENSECVQPNECACKKGYYHSGNKCLPHCYLGCAFGGTCIAPDTCACKEGYKSLRGTCVAICSQGDHCQNGVCVAKDICSCDYGFKWNNETFKCESDDEGTTTFYPDINESHQPINSMMEVETDIINSNDDIDPNQVFEEHTETTTSDVTDEYGTTVNYASAANHKCPDDFVYHKGQCLPLKFASNGVDCWQLPCLDKNAVCLENGTCACKEGFMLFETHSHNHNTTAECLTPAEHEARTQNPEKTEINKSTNWTSIFFLVIGALILAFALVFLATKLLLRQTGEIDVEGKNLACVYDKREAEKSVI